MAVTRVTLRDRIIGLLLRTARQRIGWTKAACASALGLRSSEMHAYESGQASVSLPELEVLGYILRTPVSYFLASDPDLENESASPDFSAVMALRHRIIGTLLHQARSQAGVPREDLAALVARSSDRLAAYECGEEPVPFSELEIFARHLDRPLAYFMNGNRGIVAGWHRQEEIDSRFHDLPPDLQEFIIQPANTKYLELAKKLSEMPASKLRSIAEGLLEITY